MDALQTLLAVEEIKQLKARYFRSVDTFDLEGWLDVFVDDCVLEYELTVGGKGRPAPEAFRVEGKQAVADYWNGNNNRIQSVHHGHMPEIEILSETEARGVWAMEDIVKFTDSWLQGYGHYHETYRKFGGAWKIATLRLTRLRLATTTHGMS